MKKPLVLLVALLGLGTLTPLTSDAAPDRRPPVRQETKVTYDRHGHALHWVKEYQGRDRKGRPVYSWVRDDRRPPPVVRGRDHRDHNHRAGDRDRDRDRGRDRERERPRRSILKFLFRN